MRMCLILLDHCLNENFENGKSSGGHTLQHCLQITMLGDAYAISNLYI